MAQFYHVDRTGTLAPGDSIELGWSFELGDGERVEPPKEELLRELYPEGLTRHGFRHASVIVTDEGARKPPGKRENLVGVMNSADPNDKPTTAAPHTSMYEWCLELVRRAEFPERRSRFQSVFAWEDPDSMGELRAAPNQSPRLLRVECEDYLKADMSLVKFTSLGVGMENARAYWSGETKGDPTWEILMEPPVEVVAIEEEL